MNEFIGKKSPNLKLQNAHFAIYKLNMNNICATFGGNYN